MVEEKRSLMRIGSLLALALAPVPYAVCADPLAVTAVRFWSLSDVTRIAVETNGPFSFESNRLYQPDRMFFDLRGARTDINNGSMLAIPVNDPRVRQIRVAENQPSLSRIVVDFAPGVNVDVATSQLSLPNRLMVEVRQKGAISRPPAVPAIAEPQPPQLTVNTPAPAPPIVEAVKEAAPSVPARQESPAEVVRKDEAPSLAAAANALLPPANAAATVPNPPATTPAPDKIMSGAPQQARSDSLGDRSLTRVLGLKIRRVVIDPGHGGMDYGTSGPNGLHEKDVALDVSKRLAALIEERMGSEALLTRSTDSFVPLESRPQIANSKKADLFVSVHVNSSPMKEAAGMETYYLSFTTSRQAMDLAARENASSQHSVHDLKDLVQQIAMREKLDESREFAGRVQRSLSPVSPAPAAAKNRGVKRAPFVVLIGARMPAILAEIGFISNTKEEAMMKRPDYRQKLAEALYRGIAQYAETMSHFEVAQGRASGSE